MSSNCIRIGGPTLYPAFASELFIVAQGLFEPQIPARSYLNQPSPRPYRAATGCFGAATFSPSLAWVVSLLKREAIRSKSGVRARAWFLVEKQHLGWLRVLADGGNQRHVRIQQQQRALGVAGG